MTEVDFSDVQSVSMWLRTQSQFKCCLIGVRNGLRIMPVLASADIDKFSELVLPSLRSLLTGATLPQSLVEEYPRVRGHAASVASHSAAFVAMETKDEGLHAATRAAAHVAEATAHSGVNEYAQQIHSSILLGPPRRIYASALQNALGADSKIDELSILKTPLWGAQDIPNDLLKDRTSLLRIFGRDFAWDFWVRFYEGMWEGTFTDWDLAYEIMKISGDDWEKGYLHIGKVIAGKEEDLTKSETHPPPTKAQSNAFAQRANENTQAIALTAASLMEQLSVYREVVRCSNTVDPDERQSLLDFIDSLNGSLQKLLGLLPTSNDILQEEGGSKLVIWFREFRSLIPKEAAKYVTPENVTTATVPTSIILSGTAIGTLIGGPAGGAVGTLVGGLITNQIKPAKAAEEIITSDSEAPTE